MREPTSSEWWENKIKQRSMEWYHQIRIIGDIIELFKTYHYNFYKSSIEIVNNLDVDSTTEKNLKHALANNLEPYQADTSRKQAKKDLVETCEELASIYRKNQK